MPMTIFSCLGLLFIPLFQYCHELRLVEGSDHSEKSTKLLLALIWLNFITSIFYGLEIAMKSYAFGLRRGFTQCNAIIKVEFIFQPVIWTMWFLFLADNSDHNYELQVNIFALIIMIRALRVGSLLNEISIWRNFMRTLSALLRPFFNFSVTLYSLYLIFASIGLEFFGGMLSASEIQALAADESTGVDETWLYLNFNDYVMSLNTLFGMMWQNDWE